jgi:hypothetical protein
MNIRPGMSAWHDQSIEYKEEYYKRHVFITDMKKDKTAQIIIVASYDIFIEFANSMKYSLEKIGVKNVKVVDSKDLKFDYYDLNFVIKAFRPFPVEKLQGFKILFQTEECWNNRAAGTYRWELQVGYDRVLEMYDENCKLKDTQKVVYCPVGYSPVWERKMAKVEEEDIDILFHGSLTPRRMKFYVALKEAGYKNIIFTNKHYGKIRDEFIKRAKVTINIKAHDKWSYGPMHCLPAQANKKFLMAEKADGGYGPFVPNKHFIEYDGIEDFKEKINFWLDCGREERDKFALNAYNDMIKTCDFTEILKKSLEGIL